MDSSSLQLYNFKKYYGIVRNISVSPFVGGIK